MKDRIKRAITVYVPGNACNFRCSYCYVSECLKEGHEEQAHFLYSVEHMISAFRPERIGGIAYITVIGGGETLIPAEVVPFVKGLLRQGHVVEVVTNNTLNERIEELLDAPKEDLSRLIVKCSLHWLELKRLGKIGDYFANIKKVIAAGASSYPFMVICEEYMEYWEEICARCQEEIGALPQCTPCVTAEHREDFLRGRAAVTKPACTPEFVEKVKNTFHSRLFEECVRFLDIDVSKIFCYAGKWAFGVEMDTGNAIKCHNISINFNFYENIDKKIGFDYVGCECGIANCALQYPLYGLGMIPEIDNVPTYSDMICEREGLFTSEVKNLMNIKISDDEHILTEKEKIDFLMNQVCQKNESLEKYAQVIKKARGDADGRIFGRSIQEMVEEVLTKIDENKFSYNDFRNITYDHLKALYLVSNGVDDGEIVCRRVFETIYKGMLDTRIISEVGVIYDEEVKGVIDSIRRMPITSMVAREENFEDIMKALNEADYVGLANIYYGEVQRLYEMQKEGKVCKL